MTGTDLGFILELHPLSLRLDLTFTHYFSETQSSLVAQRLKHLPAMQETWVRSMSREDPLEKETATHSSILAWRIPGTEEPGGLQSMGSQRVRHDWATSLHITSLKLRTGFASCQTMHYKLTYQEWINKRNPCWWCLISIPLYVNLLTRKSDVSDRSEVTEFAQLCRTLCNPMDDSLPGSSIHGIFQARRLEWVTISFSSDRNPIQISLSKEIHWPI